MKKNILLALGWYDHRLLRGISRYAAEHDWRIASASITQEFIIPWGWKGDGVLAWLAGEEELVDFVGSLGLPTVDFSLRRPHLPFGHVVLDHAAAARLAADHLRRRGFRHYLCCSASANWTFEERGAGFVAALAEHGLDCRWIKWQEASPPPPAAEVGGRAHGDEWARRRAWLTQELTQAPKPLAVFATNGTLAVEVMEVCESAGLDMPRQVALVGVEDDLLLPRGILHSITTVDPNLEELGYRGSALLDGMVGGGAPPAEPVRIPPARIITRHSTDILATNHLGVGKALRFIAENFAGEIDVEAVARAAGMSRRGLHQAFLEQLGCTPGEHLRAARIDNAKRLLAETNGKVETIAAGSGYPSVNSFFIAFKHACGVSPAGYRKQVRSPF